MPVNLLRSSLVAIAICCACITLAGQPRRTIQVPRAAAAPRIDGHLTDPAWKSAIQVTGFTDYVTGALVQDQTIVYAMHDEQYIYFGFDCRDIHPASITARETVRDTKFNNNNGPTNTEDNVEIDIDPFCTHSYADLNRFSVNALGTRSAATAEGRGSKAEWKGDWDAASVKTSSGWTCTIRIPWASMHYPVGKDTVPIGINFSRYIDRTKTVQEWSTTGPQGFLENEGMWTNAQPPKQAFKSKLSLLPYVLAGDVNNQAGGKIGMDGRYTLTPQLTAVGTLNPDYSNVEGSIQSISYSHSVHFIPETRFLQRVETSLEPTSTSMISVSTSIRKRSSGLTWAKSFMGKSTRMTRSACSTPKRSTAGMTWLQGSCTTSAPPARPEPWLSAPIRTMYQARLARQTPTSVGARRGWKGKPPARKALARGGARS
jgi:hypothetical protein